MLALVGTAGNGALYFHVLKGRGVDQMAHSLGRKEVNSIMFLTRVLLGARQFAPRPGGLRSVLRGEDAGQLRGLGEAFSRRAPDPSLAHGWCQLSRGHA